VRVRMGTSWDGARQPVKGYHSQFCLTQERDWNRAVTDFELYSCLRVVSLEGFLRLAMEGGKGPLLAPRLL